jgi:hypothetical protein
MGRTRGRGRRRGELVHCHRTGRSARPARAATLIAQPPRERAVSGARRGGTGFLAPRGAAGAEDAHFTPIPLLISSVGGLFEVGMFVQDPPSSLPPLEPHSKNPLVRVQNLGAGLDEGGLAKAAG